jgi:hypothetical protein
MRAKGEGNPLSIAVVTNADMESAFRTDVVGDKGTAYGPWQHHIDRVLRILENTKIDLRTERDLETCTLALLWEMRNVRAYAEAYAEMRVAETYEIATGLFCQHIEGAGAPDAKERRIADSTIIGMAVVRHSDFFAPTPAP